MAPALPLRWVLVAAAAGLAGCSSGSSSSAPATGEGWGTATQVEAIFAASCAECHGSQWSSCWDVQASASVIQEEVASGAMPQNGPLSATDKATLLDWIAAGAKCSGSPSADAGAESGPIGVVAGWKELGASRP